MLDPVRLSLFLAASFVLLITPGPAVLYIVTRSIDQGRLAGLVSVLSVEVGNSFHVLAATLGVSALLVSSALAFTVVKYLGAVYLIYLGLRRILTRAEMPPTPHIARQDLRRIFSQGVVVATLNPKTAVFFLAFLPQFVDSAQGSIALQMLVLGCLFVMMAVVTDGTYALLAGAVGQWLRDSRGFARATRLGTGSIYIGLGITMAFSEAATSTTT